LTVQGRRRKPRPERNGSSETFFDVTIDTFESPPARVPPVGVPEALRRGRNGSGPDFGRGRPGWAAVHLGTGTSVLATNHHPVWDVRLPTAPPALRRRISDLRIGVGTGPSGPRPGRPGDYDDCLARDRLSSLLE
jgi:hypothetical protein